VVRKSTRNTGVSGSSGSSEDWIKMVHQEVQEIQELVVSWFIRTNGLKVQVHQEEGSGIQELVVQVVHQEIQELVVKRSSGIKWKWYIRKFRKYRS
jgi:hypothetical protein